MPIFAKNIAISKTPYRIGLGGATDLIPYVEKFSGHAFSAALNRHVIVIARARHDSRVIFQYALGREDAASTEDIKHDYTREALRHVGIKNGIDIISLIDVPFGSGLGSSGSFTVGLLNALWALKGVKKTPRQLAEEAAHIELTVLKKPIGKHDQYLAAFGGLCTLRFLPNGAVRVKTHILPKIKLKDLESRLLLAYSGTTRSASRVLSPVHKNLLHNHPQTLQYMHDFRKIGLRISDIIQTGDFTEYVDHMNTLWDIQKKVFGSSNVHIDAMIEYGKKHGAASGMAAGAGGGGFLLFVCPNSTTRARVMKAFSARNLETFPFSISHEGSKIILTY